MICDECHENEAVISYTEISGGIKKELHLCESCASKSAMMGNQFVSLTDPSFLANLLASVLVRKSSSSDAQETMDEESLKKTNIVCPTCQMTYNEFLKFGKFGCPECYKTFHFLLDGYLMKIHGNSRHTGKEPVYSKATLEIPTFEPLVSDVDKSSEPISIMVDAASSEQELKAALKRAIMKEEYEEAARIRDLIKAGKDGKHE